jgi:ferredoxin
VACFYELADQLVIHPDECIDCAACVAECPVEAIYAEGDLPGEFAADTEFNAVQSKQLKEAGKEALTKTCAPLPTAEAKKAALGY